MILASGANVILTTGGIDDMCLKYFMDVGAMAIRRVLKRDLKRIAKASGGKGQVAACPMCPFFPLCSMCVGMLNVGGLFLSIIKTNYCPVSATVCPSLTNLEGEEAFDVSLLGHAEEVVQERVCDDELILIKK